MPESDKILIGKAEEFHWEDILFLKAQSKEAQMKLDFMANRKYHLAEHRCGML